MSNSPMVFKGHALGNDYIVTRPEALGFPLTTSSVRALCNRHRGLGADGVITIDGPDRVGSSIPVTVWNADGTVAEVSGNGLRIAAVWLCRNDRRRELELVSGGRTYPVRLGPGSLVSIDLPPPKIEARRRNIPLASRHIAVTLVDIGNPHAVIEASSVESSHWPAIAAEIELHPLWSAHGRNVERIRPYWPERIGLEIHERGVGPTTASGTGACAAASAALALGLVKGDTVDVEMAGGSVTVRVQERGLTLTGPVAPVYEARLLPELVESVAALPG